eukprot:3151693-Amphidinium_carterae.1
MCAASASSSAWLAMAPRWSSGTARRGCQLTAQGSSTGLAYSGVARSRSTSSSSGDETCCACPIV